MDRTNFNKKLLIFLSIAFLIIPNAIYFVTNNLTLALAPFVAYTAILISTGKQSMVPAMLGIFIMFFLGVAGFSYMSDAGTAAFSSTLSDFTSSPHYSFWKLNDESLSTRIISKVLLSPLVAAQSAWYTLGKDIQYLLPILPYLIAFVVISVLGLGFYGLVASLVVIGGTLGLHLLSVVFYSFGIVKMTIITPMLAAFAYIIPLGCFAMMLCVTASLADNLESEAR